MKKVFTLFALFFFLFSFSQKIEKLRLKKYKVAKLSDSLAETSGLTILKDKFYTFNDGGNPSELYEISPVTGAIVKKIGLSVPNKDWEAITNDGENLYLGDFGNNAGKRKDLAVYRISVQHPENVQKIEFEYQEQTDYSPPYLNHNYDAEAMVFLNGKIHLFTKEWASNTVSHYILDSKNQQKQSLLKTETFATGFVVTDAAYYENKLYTVGYTREGKVYMMIFEQDDKGNFFQKIPKKYKLGNAIGIGQVEGITVNAQGIFISNESFSKYFFFPVQKLYFIPFQKILGSKP